MPDKNSKATKDKPGSQDQNVKDGMSKNESNQSPQGQEKTQTQGDSAKKSFTEEETKARRKEKLVLLSLKEHAEKYPETIWVSIKERNNRRLSVQIGERWNPVMVAAEDVTPVHRQFPGDAILLGPREKRVIGAAHSVTLISDQLIGLVNKGHVELRLLENKDDTVGKRIKNLKKGMVLK